MKTKKRSNRKEKEKKGNIRKERGKETGEKWKERRKVRTRSGVTVIDRSSLYHSILGTGQFNYHQDYIDPSQASDGHMDSHQGNDSHHKGCVIGCCLYIKAIVYLGDSSNCLLA